MLKNTMIVLVGVNFLMSCNLSQEKKILYQKSDSLTQSIEKPSKNDTLKEDFVKMNFDSLGLINKMAYATEKNFTKQKIYPCAECYLRNEVAKALIKANEIAKKQNLKIVIYDCYRPLSIQKRMYDIVKNTNYVAHPSKGSKHNKGCAVDVGLADFENNLLNMGTEFDDFSENSHYSNTAFNSEERRNRKILRKLMIEAKFLPYDKEWWHFNFINSNYQNSDFQWKCF